MILGAIFDFDDTLYNYTFANDIAINKLIEKISIENNIPQTIIKSTFESIVSLIKQSNNYANKFNKNIYIKKLFEQLRINYLKLDEYIQFYNEIFESNMSIYDHVIDLLNLLKKKNIKIGLLSNNKFDQQYRKLQKLNIMHYFDIIQTSDEIGVEKPDELIYLSIINKMNLSKEHIIMIGDNIDHDINPCIKLGILPFHFLNSDSDIKFVKNYFEFGAYNNLLTFINNFLSTIDELVYLSKYFGQSTINVQGAGGNISIKFNDLLFIKSSGYILGNMNITNGYTIMDMKKNIIYGTQPSMEYLFHSFLKKYVVHIHFEPANRFLCCNNLIPVIKNSLYINYYPPGDKLSEAIKKQYNSTITTIFLQNHGIILTGDTIDDIFNLYVDVFNYFNDKLCNQYTKEYIVFDMMKALYIRFNKSYICKKYDKNIVYPINYCFPDISTYVQNIINIINIEDIKKLSAIPDIINYNGTTYIIAKDISKYYQITEILNTYIIIINNQCNQIDKTEIINMEQEKYRRAI